MAPPKEREQEMGRRVRREDGKEGEDGKERGDGNEGGKERGHGGGYGEWEEGWLAFPGHPLFKGLLQRIRPPGIYRIRFRIADFEIFR